ncbi:enoyl-CoA hydratase/isomerase family protein [Histidinibacterium aquaticum]|uniref:Enoyl-CoA hydratase/isomerase family protein n=1 Tax=Histidinibacterium aquaticum TaxID=2613962 RepID=A0A5J5GK75_9RHOB|nr:enoyl-CoA hydratase/isomerase family protein [Histidinibacterium aquaticum]KAA9007882.1 enoyl-CoA hydratase/isomerase family protein [Histidinibacterium aquaticum]
MTVRLEKAGGALRLRLESPRANALTPELLDDLSRALDEVEAAPPEALLLTGERNFCSGGDVARFLAAAEAGEARDYALRVVPVLQEVVLRLLALPAPVVTAARGAVTGGGAGLLFAADTAVLAPASFVQPYYARMGFAPDGGWTALLPERIGRGATLSWIASDSRHGAEDLRAMGLCALVDPEPETAALALLEDRSTETLAAAKRLIWNAPALARIEAGLAAETEAFLDRIDRPDTLARMRAFLGEPEHV